MSADPRPWVPIDGDLWREPGPTKLSWQARKVAIYLRAASGPWRPEGEEAVPHVALRSLARIAADNGLSEAAARKAVAALRSWPSRRKAFIAQAHERDGVYVLRPLPARWVRAYRWLLDAPLADDTRDVLLFIRSRFAGKSGGDELFDCNLYGETQPSVRRCCHLRGRGSKARSARVKEVVAELQRRGLLVVARRPGRDRAMVVRVCDATPIRMAPEPTPAARGNGRPPRGVTAGGPRGNGRGGGGVTADASAGNDTPESVPHSSSDSEIDSSLESRVAREEPLSREPQGGGTALAAPEAGGAAQAASDRPPPEPGHGPPDREPPEGDGEEAPSPDAEGRATETKDGLAYQPRFAARYAAAAKLDHLLALIRDPQADHVKRLQAAVFYQKGTEDVIPQFDIRWRVPRVRKLAAFLEAVQQLEPEVITQDLIAALEVLSEFDEPCWPVALEENTWSLVSRAAAGYAGIRLTRECRLVSYRGTALDAVRDLLAGRADRRGNPVGSAEPGASDEDGRRPTAAEPATPEDRALDAVIEWVLAGDDAR